MYRTARKYAVASILSRIPREGEGNQGGTGTPPPPPPAQQTPSPTPPAPGEVDIGGIKFTPIQQQKLNALIAEERRKQETTNRTLVEQLEQLKRSSGMTEQEKTALQARIDELTATYTTKEQQQQTEYQKLEKKLESETKKSKETVDTLTRQLHNKYKQVDLTEAATTHKAISNKQVVTILWDQTVVEEALDENGRPTGELVTRVNFEGKDKEGKPVKLKLSPKDAVKAMTEMPDEYGNLFENTSRGGLGQGGNQSGNGGNGRIPNIEEMSPQDYTKYRQQIRQQMANKQE